MALNAKNRFVLLILIMAGICLATTGVSLQILYRTAMAEERERLTETAQSQARLIEAVARFDAVYSADYPEGPMAATLSQIRDAHKNYRGFGQTGEFTLARRNGNEIAFILSHRHDDLDSPRPVSMDLDLAQPMKLALAGKSGTIIGLDYRGERVLAAHEPVGELGLGIVAKIDMSEIRSPFVRAAVVVAGLTGVFVLLGAFMILRVSIPILQRLESQNRDLQQSNQELVQEIDARKRTESEREQLIQELRGALDEVKTLSGLLPICSFCKKIRDDQGYWNKLESYIQEHSHAQFSHSICRECAKKHYPDLDLYK